MATAPFAAPLFIPRTRLFTAAGAPLNGGKVYTYAAGTSTPLATYPTYADALAGTNANANPVVLDSAGEAAIFLTNTFYKIVAKDSTDVTQWTMDYVGPALGFPQPYPTEWVNETGAFVYVSATSFTITGVDATATYHVGRRIKTVNTGGTRYSTITASSFAANTTVTVINDSSTLDSGLSAVAYGHTSYINPSYQDPRTALSVVKNGVQTGFAPVAKVTTWTVDYDALSEWSAGSHRWVCKYPGKYLVTMQAELQDTVATQAVVLHIYKDGASVRASADYTKAATSTSSSLTVSGVFNLTAGQYIEMYLLGTANTSVRVTNVGTGINIVRIP